MNVRRHPGSRARGIGILRELRRAVPILALFVGAGGCGRSARAADPELHGLHELARLGAHGIFGEVATDGDRIAIGEGNAIRLLETGAADSPASGTLVARGIVPMPFDLAPSDLAISGDVALGAGESGVAVVHLADPDAPTVVATIPARYSLQGRLTRVALRGPLALVLDLDGSRLFDLSDPTAPVPLGSWEFAPGQDPDSIPKDATLDGSFAYEALASYQNWEPTTIAIHDVSNPTAPVERGRIRLDEATYRVPDLVEIAARDGIVLAGSLDRLIVVDARDPDAPVRLASILDRETPPSGFTNPLLEPGTTRAWGVARSLDENGCLGLATTVDLADPANPVLLGMSSLASKRYATEPFEIAPLAGRIVFARDREGLELRDDPASGGEVLGAFRPPVSASEPVVIGERVLFADHLSRLRAAELSDLAAFERDDAVTIPTSADPVVRVAGAGGFAFVGGSGVSIFEANPVGGGPPIEIGHADAPGVVAGLDAFGSALVVCTNTFAGPAPNPDSGPGFLATFDLADPTSPSLNASLASLPPAVAVGIGGGWIRLACAPLEVQFWPVPATWPTLKLFRLDAAGEFVAHGEVELPARPFDLVSDADGAGYYVAYSTRVARYEAPADDPLAPVERWSVSYPPASWNPDDRVGIRLQRTGASLLVAFARVSSNGTWITGETLALDVSGAAPALFASALGPGCRGAAALSGGRVLAAFEGAPGASLMVLEPVPAPLDVMLGDLDPTPSSDLNEDGVVDAADALWVVPGGS